MKAQDYAEYKDLRLNLSQLASGNSAEGEVLGSYFATTPQGQAYLDLLKDNRRMVQKVCPADEPNCADEGRMGVMINDEWTSISKINQEINKNLFDKGFQSGLGGLADKLTEASLKVKEGENVQYPEKLINQQLQTLLGSSANRKSVFYDKMFGNTSMYQDLVEHIASGTYADLGVIPKDLIKKLDTDGGSVDIEDAGKIARELLDNPNYVSLANAEALRYFGGFLKQNWNNGAEGRVTTAPGYEMTKGGRYIKSTPGGGGLGDFPMELDNEDEFASSNVKEQDFSQYDNISIGGKRLSDILKETESKEQRDELIRVYGNVKLTAE